MVILERTLLPKASAAKPAAAPKGRGAAPKINLKRPNGDSDDKPKNPKKKK